MLGDGLLQASITIGNQRAHLIILSLHSLKGLLPLVLICWESVDMMSEAFLVSLTVMWNPIAVSLCSRPHLLLWSSTSSRWRSPWHTYLSACDCSEICWEVELKKKILGELSCLFAASAEAKEGSGSCGGLVVECAVQCLGELVIW